MAKLQSSQPPSKRKLGNNSIDRLSKRAKHVVGFLDLPGELRNKIYQELFQRLRCTHPNPYSRVCVDNWNSQDLTIRIKYTPATEIIHPEAKPIFCPQCFSEEFTIQNSGVVTIPKRPQFTPHSITKVSRRLSAETMSLFFEEGHIHVEIDQLEKWRDVFSPALTHHAKDLTIWLNKDLHALSSILHPTVEQLGFEAKCNWGMANLTPLLRVLIANPELDGKFVGQGARWRVGWMTPHVCCCEQLSNHLNVSCFMDVRCRAPHINDISSMEGFWDIIRNKSLRGALANGTFSEIDYDFQSFWINYTNGFMACSQPVQATEIGRKRMVTRHTSLSLKLGPGRHRFLQDRAKYFPWENQWDGAAQEVRTVGLPEFSHAVGAGIVW